MKLTTEEKIKFKESLKYANGFHFWTLLYWEIFNKQKLCAFIDNINRGMLYEFAFRSAKNKDKK